MKKKISIAVTTYGTQSYYTYFCLESIRSWKKDHHELIVACHDESLLLKFYLQSCLADGLIDKLIFTPHNFGHTMGVNKCFENATGDFFVNIANDIQIGPVIVDDCVSKLEYNHSIGLIGWHWYSDGTFYDGNGNISKYTLRDNNQPLLNDNDIKNIKNAKWFTGKLFNNIGPKWLQLCNTAFFCCRKDTWLKIGGFDTVYKHYWADDFLNYAILDQGLSVVAFEHKFKTKPYFHETQYSNTDVADRKRNEDYIPIPEWLEHYCGHVLNGGMNKKERSLIYYMSKCCANKTIMHVGLWRGASLALSISSLDKQQANFIGIDCFDIPEISKFSAQPPTTQSEVTNYINPLLNKQHSLNLIKENTLNMTSFPQADMIFIDAGHTKECVQNDTLLAMKALKENGLMVFHDYNCKSWPDVKPVLDNIFGNKIKTYETIAVVQT